jgi:hypothetical protein
MSNVEALSAGDITKVGVIVIVALVVIGIVLSFVITALVGRIIILVAVVVLGAFVWQQRSSIQDKIAAKKCNWDVSFFFIHLDPPQSVKDACSNLR